jgi:hypothetical protein
LRLAHGGCHSNLLPSTDEFATYFNGADGCLFLDGCDDEMPEEMESLWDKSRMEKMCTAFYEMPDGDRDEE